MGIPFPKNILCKEPTKLTKSLHDPYTPIFNGSFDWNKTLVFVFSSSPLSFKSLAVFIFESGVPALFKCGNRFLFVRGNSVRVNTKR